MARSPKKVRQKRRRSSSAQLHLAARGRGGWRPNAGRPKTGRTHVAHRARPRHVSRHPVHVTMRVRSDVPPLRRARLRRILAHAFWRMHRGQRRRVHGFRICHYSIQNDHVHLLVEASHARALSRGMQGLSISIAKRINNAVDRRGAVWAERYDARELPSPTEVRNALVYVLQNGRHHPMGPNGQPVPSSCLDACSSAPYFAGWKERGIPRAPPEHDAPIASPKTWLLREGWRRAGAISIFDSPAEKRPSRARRARSAG